MNGNAGQTALSVVENSEADGSKDDRKQSPLTRELGALRRIVEVLEGLPLAARERVLTHAQGYISTPQPKEQQEFDL
jgi:hypothetical protein